MAAGTPCWRRGSTASNSWRQCGAAEGRWGWGRPTLGGGVVPETSAGRLFRDELGALNAALAEVCEQVVLLVAGIPLTLRGADMQAKRSATTVATTAAPV